CFTSTELSASTMGQLLVGNDSRGTVRSVVKAMTRLQPFTLLGLGALLLGAGCSPNADPSRINVLLVVIDTARADKFGCYGHESGLTPRIDELARSGIVFESASAHAPWTLPSTASLLTSLHPPEHGAGGSLHLDPSGAKPPAVEFHALGSAAVTLAEVFQAHGWRTGAVVNVDFLDRAFGLTQGVDDLDARAYASNLEVRSASDTTDEALRWIDERDGQPFFLLAHYFDAHAVYAPPASFRRAHANPVDQDNTNFTFGTRAHMMMLRAGKLELEPDLMERAERLYEAELAYIDEQVGRLLTGLEEAGIDDSTLIVLTADHGEEFLDHSGFEHGHTLYEELLHVPLIMKLGTHWSAGRRVQESIGLLDVAPTICEVAGLEIPREFMGRSLSPALSGAALKELPILAHGNFWGEPLVCWRRGQWKMILTPGADGEPRMELYDLSVDPMERNDQSLAQPKRTERMGLELELARARYAARHMGTEVVLDPEMAARLQSLGYLGEGEPAEDGDQ
ncbi:MAG: choline-sulfatase, partial [Candidatus Paceibacteria bacterium]